MVDSVVPFVLQNLQRLLQDEFKLLSGVERQINSLCKELRFIDVFLKSSEGKRKDEVVKEVVNQIIDVAHKAEDVIDTYVANITIHRNRKKLKKLFHLKEHVMVLHDVNAEIESIKSSIDEIYKNKERYGITQGEFKSEEVVAAAESLRKRRRDVEEEHVVGLMHDSTQVIRQLKEGDLHRKVVSIIGMGGLGKTTLARKIYNTNKVKESFPYRAWGYVSNDYRPRELLLSLLKCLLSTIEYNDLFKKKKDEDEADATNEEKLKTKLEELLKRNKYLIVLDDIWKTQVWDEVKGAFPDDKNGSRILITSRMNDVALYTGTTSPYNLPLLNKQESWELFSKRVFGEEECPSHLEPLGRSITESCWGLPLAIVVLAGLVAKKEKSQREWKRIKEISWHLTEGKTEVMDILKLSYDSLPPRLRTCFLYFGIYPEDYEISARQMINLWIAEGFMHEAGISNPAELEDIADYYLDELVDRSLVQVASRGIDGGVKTCRIHDLLRDLCISESKGDKFLEVCIESNVETLSYANPNPRRLSFHCKPDSCISLNKFNQSCTRSLFFFSDNEENDLKSFKLARVLYSKASISSLLIDWKPMVHLRYLRIDAYVDNIPASIRNLWNLEKLEVGNTGTVSSEIWKLKQLKHLRISHTSKVPVLPEAHRNIKGNLKTLCLGTLDSRGMVSVLKSDIFPRLRKLKLECPNNILLPSLHRLSNLSKLNLTGYIGIPFDTNLYPSKLTKITLKLKSLVRDDNSYIKTLGQLANLQFLKLERPKPVLMRHFKFGAGEFTQLEVLKMKGLTCQCWTLEKGAMLRLRSLVIDKCDFFDELPQQLWCLTTLQEVRVLRPCSRLANSLRNVELKNGCKLIVSNAP